MEAHGTGEQRIRIREFIAHVRNDGATAPLQVEILNPERIGAVEKILVVKRDDSEEAQRRSEPTDQLKKRARAKERMPLAPL